jgi:tetratricopeptide (TPR) repeat protein
MTELRERLRRAADLYRRGDLGGARTESEAALVDDPADADLLRFLGHICCRMGDFTSGAGYLRRCLDLDEADAGVRIDLARALAALGDLDGAAALCEPAAVDAGAAAELARIHGYVLQTRGRAQEAALCYERVVAHQPSDFEAWNNLGNARRQSGEHDGAMEALTRAASLRPDLAIIQLNLGAALADGGRLEKSLSAFEKAARLAPENRDVLLELSRALNRLDRPADALAPLAEAERVAREDPVVQAELGQTHAGLGDLAEAEARYRRAIHLGPALPDAWNHLALLLESSNRAAELGTMLGEAEAAGVPAADLAFARALHARRQGRFEEALALAGAAPPATEPHRRAQLIGEICDRLGDAEGAFAAFAEMNAALAALPSEPRAAARTYRQALKAQTGLIDPAFHASWGPAPPPSVRPPPVFLVGFPRSGTTLLDTLLMGHSQIEVIEEKPLLEPVVDLVGEIGQLPGLKPEEIEALRALYFEALDCHSERAADRLVVDKMPLNMINAALIHRLFPEARFIFAERHPADVVLSCFMTNFRLNPAMANFLDLGDAARLYDLVMRHWDRCRAVLPLDVHVVRYEEMVADLAGALRPLLAFLDLPWDEAMLDHQETARGRLYVASASYAQVTEPIYARASGRWRRYRGEMEDVLPMLAPWAEKLGYEM